LALVGVAVWGVGMGSQESIMRAAVAAMVPRDRRASAYGIFNAAYGVLWFLGSALMGFFYDRSVMTVVAFAVIMQLASVPIFLLAGNALKARS
jgi:MFS-type transporter involved in bile tolerance (Atg22 family)